MSTTYHPIEPWAANLILAGVNRLDCAITTLGCVMMDLDHGDSPSEVEAIKWLYGALREEAKNIRDSVAMAEDPKSCGTTTDAAGAPRVLELA